MKQKREKKKYFRIKGWYSNVPINYICMNTRIGDIKKHIQQFINMHNKSEKPRTHHCLNRTEVPPILTWRKRWKKESQHLEKPKGSLKMQKSCCWGSLQWGVWFILGMKPLRKNTNHNNIASQSLQPILFLEI